MHALILANGDPPPAQLLCELRAGCELFIAADGAAEAAFLAECPPDIVLGDLDSLSAHARTLAGDGIVHAADQDASDLEKAIEHALARDATAITLTGTLGGRIDHQLTAISLLLKYAARADILIVEAGQRIWPVTSRLDLDGAPGDTVSLVPFGAVEGVTTEGLRWPLSNEPLAPGSRGVSNEMLGTGATVRVTSGVLIVCHLAQPPHSR